MKRLRRRFLTIRDILTWADACREATGKWPTKSAGDIPGTIGESWAGIDQALREGLRGLRGGSSLARLLADERGVRNIHRLPPLTEEQILAWADAFHQGTGSWPTRESGTIPDSGGEKWSSVDVALRLGARVLPGGSSLAKLLAHHRGVRNRKQLPPLTEEQILAWADLHHRRTGHWPDAKSGPIADAPGETWMGVQVSLNHGVRGLPGGSSLALLLAERRGVQNAWNRPNLALEQILTWADAFHERTGKWPNLNSGPVQESPQETWNGVNGALKKGSRGLPGGFSLAELLAVERAVRNKVAVPRLSRRRILAWAAAHFRRTGDWPTRDAGPIPEAPGETWQAIDAALRQGCRGLQGGSSLARLLADHRKKRNHLALPPLSKKKILAWADAHFQRTGKWPTANSGPVQDAVGERWNLIDYALRQGQRGLPGGSSLLRLLVKKRGVRNPLCLPPLTEDDIVRWATQHVERTGTWPKYNSGPIPDAPGETWAAVDSALRHGKRSLAGSSSLAKFVARAKESAAIGHLLVPADARQIESRYLQKVLDGGSCDA